jgi:hypothetical protein
MKLLSLMAALLFVFEIARAQTPQENKIDFYNFEEMQTASCAEFESRSFGLPYSIEQMNGFEKALL